MIGSFPGWTRLTVSHQLRPLDLPIVDGENNAIELDVAYRVSADRFIQTLELIVETHGPEVRLLPLSGTSGGGGIFQRPKPAGATVVGLRFSTPAMPRVHFAGSHFDITAVALDEIVIDRPARRVYAGSGITLEQLNRALSEELGVQFKVLGADLTSYTYAQVGATFMTGGMGPQRRYFSDSVSEISLYDGVSLNAIEGDELIARAGTYGWTGLVTAVCCRYHELPNNEVAFAIPVNNTPRDLARLLEHFAANCYLGSDDSIALTATGSRDLIMGLEHVTVGSMQPFLLSGDNALTKRAQRLVDNCNAAGADGLIFVNGYSDKSGDDFLMSLIDDVEADEPTIAGINLEHTEVFNNPDQMRAVREGVPFAARTQAPSGRFSFKGHTDAVVRLNADCVGSAMQALWEANERYVKSVEEYFSERSDVHGEILVYGHLNPVGVDPHNRITLAGDDEAAFRQAIDFTEQKRDEFYRAVRSVCESTQSIFVGGEKSSASEAEIVPALGGLDNTPSPLRQRIEARQRSIANAHEMFRWRAIEIN